MTIPRLASMTRYWNKHPPVHVLVAGYLGYEAKGEERKAPTQVDLKELMAAFPERPKR